jgi:hypothetical protein
VDEGLGSITERGGISIVSVVGWGGSVTNWGSSVSPGNRRGVGMGGVSWGSIGMGGVSWGGIGLGGVSWGGIGLGGISWGSISDWGGNFGNNWCGGVGYWGGNLSYQRFLADNGVESVDVVSGVVDSSAGTIRVNQRVRSLDNISITGFVLAL